ncbi:MAG: tRNA (cytidine(34)-2'-O)-methyltransferase [Tissierellia bacterium]|nr:tRNA (cytidine(34)-2'-O)-methyltransferase [Tissierellia bacterium]
MSFHIVLVEPEIPYNTGAIARTCALTKTSLHLVHPLGFSTDDKHLKRAGLDYWHLVEISHYDSLTEVMEKYREHKFYFATTKAEKLYSDPKFKDGDFIVFGKETKGLPETLLKEHKEECIKIPMLHNYGRSLNLANSANIILFEALRQNNFFDLD